jgi:hypothetical protein
MKKFEILEEVIEKIKEYNEEKHGHCKDSCESEEYDAINDLIKFLGDGNE